MGAVVVAAVVVVVVVVKLKNLMHCYCDFATTGLQNSDPTQSLTSEQTSEAR